MHQPHRRLRHEGRAKDEGQQDGAADDVEDYVGAVGSRHVGEENPRGEEQGEEGTQGAPNRRMGDLADVDGHEDAGCPGADSTDESRDAYADDVPGCDQGEPARDERHDCQDDGPLPAEPIGDLAGRNGTHDRAQRQQGRYPRDLTLGQFREEGLRRCKIRQNRRRPAESYAGLHADQCSCKEMTYSSQRKHYRNVHRGLFINFC